MISFQQIASKTIGGCSLMTNRTKVSTDRILAEHPDFITILQFDFAASTQGQFAVVELAEYTNSYYPCGMSITNICREWVAAYEGDIEQANADLKASGGCKVRLERVRTNKGNAFVKVTVL